MTFRASLYCLLFALATPAVAQDRTAPDRPVSPDEQASVVERISTLLAERYVFADTGREAGTYLRERLDAGAYDETTAPTGFADALTEDLRHITRDKHLRVRLEETSSSGPPSPTDLLRQRLAWQERERADNLGIQSVRVLEGNVGYLDLRFFPSEEEVREAYDAALGLLANVDALIVDERRHGGGAPSGVRYLTSYFFDEPTHLNSLHYRDGDTETVEEFWTHAEVGGPQRPDLPLYVLTSDRTFSGAEEFANNLKELKRATIVGETTGGGANPGGTMPAGERFNVFVPTGRAVNPLSGTNWEGVGVEPDVKVPAERALDRALELAQSAADTYRATRERRNETMVQALSTGLREAETAFASGQDASDALHTTLRAALDTGLIDEAFINVLGYEYLGTDRPALAIALFRFNTEAFPDSWNVHDSLAEALAAHDQTDEAITLYEKARSMAPEPQQARIDDVLDQLHDQR